MKTITLRMPDDEYENLQASKKMLNDLYFNKINQSLTIRIILEDFYRCNVKSYLSETVKELKKKKTEDHSALLASLPHSPSLAGK